MTARPVKRSVVLNGHRTSVSLEGAFWQAFRDLAARQGKSLNALAAEIDAGRAAAGGGTDVGLASAIRVWVLQQAQAQGKS
jgi:predicted DNA-binding ribbon-helix-helix protein